MSVILILDLNWRTMSTCFNSITLLCFVIPILEISSSCNINKKNLTTVLRLSYVFHFVPFYITVSFLAFIFRLCCPFFFFHSLHLVCVLLAFCIFIPMKVPNDCKLASVQLMNPHFMKLLEHTESYIDQKHLLFVRSNGTCLFVVFFEFNTNNNNPL